MSRTRQDEGGNVIVESGATEIVRLVFTAGVVAFFFFLAMGLSEAGWLEEASAFVTVFVVQIAKFMYADGIFHPRDNEGPTDLSGSATEKAKFIARTMYEAYQEWTAKSSPIRWVLLSAGYATAFMVLRSVLMLIMHGVMGNFGLRLAAAILLGTVLVAPHYVFDALRTLKSEDDAQEGTTPAQTQVPRQSSAAQAQAAPAPAPAAPAATPAQTPKPRAFRRAVSAQKENTDV